MQDNMGGVDDFMPLRWIKSNWTVLSFLGVMAVSGIVGFRDVQNDLKNLSSELLNIVDTAKDRSTKADDFYKTITEENLPLRVKMLEDQAREMREALAAFQRGQSDQLQLVRDGFSDLRTQVLVVSSKVDDLRQQQPQKTNFKIK